MPSLERCALWGHGHNNHAHYSRVHTVRTMFFCEGCFISYFSCYRPFGFASRPMKTAPRSLSSAKATVGGRNMQLEINCRKLLVSTCFLHLFSCVPSARADWFVRNTAASLHQTQILLHRLCPWSCIPRLHPVLRLQFPRPT